MTTKILALIDALGNLATSSCRQGKRFDTIDVEPPIEGINLFDTLLRDKAFDRGYYCSTQKTRCQYRITQHLPSQPLKIDEKMYNR